MKTSLEKILLIIQQDPGNRGLGRLPDNLFNHSPQGFQSACKSLANSPHLGVVIFTGFTIPNATPPAPETDGPPGALFLAITLSSLGHRVAIACENNCLPAFEAALNSLNLQTKINLIESPLELTGDYASALLTQIEKKIGFCSHFIAIEKCGPSYSLETNQQQTSTSKEQADSFLSSDKFSFAGKILTMSCKDITHLTSPVYLCFDPLFCASKNITRIGIGDGGNEIGMGNIPRQIIAANINNGALIACSTTVDFLITAGVSNWGAYALGAGVLILSNQSSISTLDHLIEKNVLHLMVEKGNLVDGRFGQPIASIDGIDWNIHADVIQSIVEILKETS